MRFTYKQSTGEMFHGEHLLGKGYAGRGPGRNNPALQHVANVGPIPRGLYTVGRVMQRHPTAGLFVIRLEQAPGNEMFGRAGFLIHGNNATNDASRGCIILPRLVREKIAACAGAVLEVVE